MKNDTKARILFMFIICSVFIFPQSTFAYNFLNDTFVATGGSGYSYNTSAGASHGSDTKMIFDDGGIGSQFDSFAQAYRLQDFLRTDNTAFNDKIILSMYMTVNNVVLNGSCTDTFNGSQIIRWVNETQWYDDMTYTDSPVLSNKSWTHYNISWIDFSASAAQKNSSSFGLNNYVIDSFYNHATSTLFINALNGKCNGLGSSGWFDSMEGTSPPTLNVNTASIATYQSNNTDVAGAVYVDFESGTVSTTAFYGYDLGFYPSTYAMVSAVPQAFYSLEYDDSNTMASVTCGTATYFDPMLVTNLNHEINLNPDGERMIYCFNLTSQHNGQQFYGAVKFLHLNNTRGGSANEGDIYFTLYSPSYITISALTGVNVTAGEPIPFFWYTNVEGTTTLWYRYRVTASDNPTGFIALQGNNGTTHAVFIPPAQSFQGIYEAYGESLINGTVYDTAYINLTIGLPAPSGSAADLGVTSGIHIRVKDNVNLPLQAYVIFGNTSSRLTQKVPDNGSITYYSQISSYYGFPDGTYPLQVYQTGYTAFNGNFNVTSQPFVYDVALTPYAVCQLIYTTVDNNTCGVNTKLLAENALLNYTSWYCEFDPNACQVYDNTTGGCLKAGLWNGYGCLNDYHPEGKPINATATIGSQGGAGGFTDIISALFGTQTQATLGFISMLIVGIIAALVAWKTQDGLITAVISLIFIGMFASVGWVPIWLIIVLTVAIAFLVAKFVRQAFTPQ